MTQKKIEFHEAASEEYLVAFLWYFERSEAVAARFSQELSRAIDLISRAPKRWP
jgi:plasmid stabilization system protein ParE